MIFLFVLFPFILVSLGFWGPGDLDKLLAAVFLVFGGETFGRDGTEREGWVTYIALATAR